jgi:hypothetical protein
MSVLESVLASAPAGTDTGTGIEAQTGTAAQAAAR